MTLLTFLFFTALVGALTWRLTRADDHTTSIGYFLAGRSLTGGFIAGSLLLTNLSTEQLVGLNGAAFTDGVAVMAWEVIAAACLALMALYFLPRYLRGGIATVPQLLGERFDETARAISSFIFIAAYAAILLPIILYTGATGLAGMLDLPALTGIESKPAILWLTVWFIGILASLYAIFGGLRTVAVSDTLNGFGLLVGGVLITYLGLRAVSSDGVWTALHVLQRAHPEKFNSIGGPNSSVPFSTLFTGVLLLNLFYWTTNQQIIQRALAARSLAEGQKGVLIAALFKMLAPVILVLPGIIAFHLYGGDGIQPDQAYGTLVRNVLPQWLSGFFAAVMVGAVLSSFNSVLNSTATLYSLGVYRHWLKRDRIDDLTVIRNGKWIAALVALFAMCTAPLLGGQPSIFAYLQRMNGLYFIPIFAVVLGGLLLPRVDAAAANVTLLGTSAVLILGYFVPPFAGWARALHDFHFLGVVFAGAMLYQLLMSWLRPRATAWQQTPAGDVDLTPWRWATPLALAIVAAVLAIYMGLARHQIG